jgi:hypothetical protein
LIKKKLKNLSILKDSINSFNNSLKDITFNYKISLDNKSLMEQSLADL